MRQATVQVKFDVYKDSHNILQSVKINLKMWLDLLTLSR